MATPPQIDRLSVFPSTGTIDDDDNSNDEREGENEPPVRELDDRTQAPEEFEVDDEDGPNESGGTLRIGDEASASAGASAVGDEDWSDVEDDDGMDGEVKDADIEDDLEDDDDDEDDLEDDDDLDDDPADDIRSEPAE